MADAQLNETRVADLLGQLQKVYTNRKKPLTVEFDQEKEANIRIVKQLGAKLPPAGFDLSRPIGVGSTATRNNGATSGPVRPSTIMDSRIGA